MRGLGYSGSGLGRACWGRSFRDNSSRMDLGVGFQEEENHIWQDLESDIPGFKFEPSWDLSNLFHHSKPQFPPLLQEISVKACLVPGTKKLLNGICYYLPARKVHDRLCCFFLSYLQTYICLLTNFACADLLTPSKYFPESFQ